MRIPARSIALLGAVALALANLGRIPAGALAGRNAPITLADLVVALVWVALLFGLLTRRVRIVVDGVLAAAVLFAAVAAASTTLAIARLGFSFDIVAFLARWVLYFGWYPFVAWCLTASESRDANRFVDGALMAICAFGIFQSLFLGEFASMLPQVGDMPAWEYQGRRLVSTLLDPNFAGGMAVLALLPLLARAAEGDTRGAWWMLVPAVAIALTASRSSVLALGAGLGVLVLARGLRRPLVKVLGVGVLLTLPAIPALIAFGESMHKFSVDASAAQRLVTWKRALTLFLEHPWLGIGFNATRQAQQARGWVFIGGGDTAFDGGILFVMVMTGVVGAILYSLLLGRGVVAARRVWRDRDSDAADRAHAAATAASVVAILVHSFFSNSLLLPFVMQVLWVRFGRLAHLGAMRRARVGLAVAVPLVALSACSPCFGTTSCTTDYRVRLQGTIVDYATGTPVGNALVSVTFTGSEARTVVSDTTDASGRWELRAPTSCCDDVRASATVHAPGQQPYVVPEFRARTLSNTGDVDIVGTWLNRPFVRYGITFLKNGTEALSGAQVTFVQQDGVPYSALRLDTSTDAIGIARFDLFSDRIGNVLGSITITHPSLSQPVTIQGISIPITNRYELPHIVSMSVYQ